MDIRYTVDDKRLSAAEFIPFANGVWAGEYDPEKVQQALERTVNITAYDGETLVGCLRILTDGYFFGTITELLVLPSHQRQGIGEPPAAAGEGTHAHPAVFRRPARRGAILRGKRLQEEPAVLCVGKTGNVAGGKSKTLYKNLYSLGGC